MTEKNFSTISVSRRLLFICLLMLVLCTTGVSCVTMKVNKLLKNAEQEMQVAQHTGSPERAIRLMESAATLEHKRGALDKEASIYHRLGTFLLPFDKTKSLDFYLKAADIYQKVNASQAATVLKEWVTKAKNQLLMAEGEIPQKTDKVVTWLLNTARKAKRDDEEMALLTLRYQLFGRETDRDALVTLAQKLNTPEAKAQVMEVQAEFYRRHHDLLRSIMMHDRLIAYYASQGNDGKELHFRLINLPAVKLYHPRRVVREMERMYTILEDAFGKSGAEILGLGEASFISFKDFMEILSVLQELPPSISIVDSLRPHWQFFLDKVLNPSQRVMFYSAIMAVYRQWGMSSLQDIHDALAVISSGKVNSEAMLQFTEELLQHSDTLAQAKELIARLDKLKKGGTLNESEMLQLAKVTIRTFLLEKQIMAAGNVAETTLHRFKDKEKVALKFTFGLDVASLFLEFSLPKEVISQLKTIEGDLPLVQKKLNLHSRYLNLMSAAGAMLKDYFVALNYQHNEFALYSKLKGYEQIKAEVYERIGDYSMQAGYIDLKFNPFDIAYSFIAKFDIPGLGAQLFRKKAITLQNAKVPSPGIVMKTYVQWLDHSWSYLHDEPTSEKVHLNAVVDWLTRHQFAKEAIALLDLYTWRKVAWSHIPGEIPELHEIVRNAVSEQAHTDSVYSLLVYLGVLEKTRAYLLHKIEETLKLASDARAGLPTLMKTWKRYSAQSQLAVNALNKAGFPLHLSFSTHIDVLSKYVEKLPREQALLYYFRLEDRMYVFTIYRLDIRFVSTWSTQFQHQELGRLKNDPDAVELLIHRPLKTLRKAKKIVAILAPDLKDLPVKEMMSQSPYHKRLNFVTVRNWDFGTMPDEK